jgi:hypothetical protein
MTERIGLEDNTLTIRIPRRLQRRGGRKRITTPEGTAAPTRTLFAMRPRSRHSSERIAGGSGSRVAARNRSLIARNRRG